jgi:hypothetical protein
MPMTWHPIAANAPATVIDTPATAYFLAGLPTGITGDKSPLRPPAPYEAMQKFMSTVMPSGTSLVGDLTKLGSEGGRHYRGDAPVRHRAQEGHGPDQGVHAAGHVRHPRGGIPQVDRHHLRLIGAAVWPFKPKAARASRSVPSLPYIDGTAWAALGSTTTSTITVQQAESLAALLSSVNAIAGTIGSLPAYVTKADDTRAEVLDHPLQRLIDFGTDENTSWSDFIESLLASALLRGDGLAEIETDDRGRRRALHALPWPHAVAR